MDILSSRDFSCLIKDEVTSDDDLSQHEESESCSDSDEGMNFTNKSSKYLEALHRVYKLQETACKLSELIHLRDHDYVIKSPVRVIEFKMEQKLLVPPPDDPFQAFQLLFDDQLLDLIVKQTNKIFTSSSSRRRHVREEHWTVMTRTELMTLMGLLLHTAMTRMDRLTDYWRTHYLSNVSCYSIYMSRQRFNAILNSLNFMDTENYDHFGNIRTMIADFNNKMKKIYYPGKQLLISKPLVFCGNSVTKSKSGDFMLHVLSEPGGMVLKSCYGCDESTRKSTGNKSGSSNNQIEKLVFNLIDDKLDTGHSVYIDEYYNSYKLAVKLLDRETYCNGILNVKKKLWKNVIAFSSTTKFGAGEKPFGVHIDKCVCLRGKRTGLYISTEFTEEIQLKAIIQYNRYFSERPTQMAVPCPPRHLHWNTKVFIQLLHMAMVNAFHLYTRFSPGRKMNMHDFRLAVLDKLLPKVSAEERLHELTKINTKRSKTVTSKDCAVCNREGVKSETTYHCNGCEGALGYCAECFCKAHVYVGSREEEQ